MLQPSSVSQNQGYSPLATANPSGILAKNRNIKQCCLSKSVYAKDTAYVFSFEFQVSHQISCMLGPQGRELFGGFLGTEGVDPDWREKSARERTLKATFFRLPVQATEQLHLRLLPLVGLSTSVSLL